MSTTAIFYITNSSFNLAKRLQTLYPDAEILKFNSRLIANKWMTSKNIICIMATGIVVRTIAPLIKKKKTDPAVIVLDEKGKYAISLLSGHIGGANKITKEIANFLGSKAVITTASDASNLTAIDLWAEENNFEIENWKILPHISTKLINNGVLKIYLEQKSETKLPKEFLIVKDGRDADVLITNKMKIHSRKQLYLRPKNLVLGIGCNSGTPAEEIADAVKKTLRKNNLSFLSIHCIATIDRKGNEKGLVTFAKKHGFELKTFTPAELNSAISNQQLAISTSDAAFRAIGAYAVSEPAALLASGTDKLLIPKQKVGNVAVAVGEKPVRGQESGVKGGHGGIIHPSPITLHASLEGKLYIVGTGPGSIEHITPAAQKAIRESDVIVGYSTYLDLIHEMIKDKEVISTGMTQEIDRCKKAVELASTGKAVAVISGGDPGVYAMAGLVFEMLKSRNWEVVPMLRDHFLLPTSHFDLDVTVIPGVSALNACAAKLGAPLMHDFACISLSDRLTPWDLIEKRLETAAKADFVIVLYNPKSKGRVEHIKKAKEIILRHRGHETPVGIAKGAMRKDEKITITNLKYMLNYDINMQTTLIIGNSQTFIWKNWMITPRGYKNKFKS